MDQHAFAYSEEYVKPTSGERAEFEIRNALEAFRNARPEHALKVRFSIACFTLRYSSGSEKENSSSSAHSSGASLMKVAL
mmetsp:Transcript_39531/g.157012  ORF Transcript_39531/g.157012 Transcript_39531/m.157012 type:complete len:80 (-) Transcript_39531:1297-1536(-)